MVRLKVSTLDNRLVLSRPGQLSESDRTAAVSSLELAFG